MGYERRAVDYGVPTMRNVNKVLATQYDPLGFILPCTTRAKVLWQRLWDLDFLFDLLGSPLAYANGHS